MDKLKVFISMPMNGKTKSEIDECTQQAVADIHTFIDRHGYKGKKDYDIEAFSGYVELEENPNIRNSALNYMGASLQKMAEADVVWACVGWKAARGCLLEIKAASAYGIDTINIREEINSMMNRKYVAQGFVDGVHTIDKEELI